MRVAKDIRAAIGLLTVLPSGDGVADARPAAYFPWVGWLFGVLAVGMASAAVPFLRTELGALLVGVVIVGVSALGSRMLHWDGLADVSDAWWGGYGVERRQEIMRDSNVGSFAVVSVILFLMLQVASIALVFASRDWWALGAAPVLGRLAASAGSWWVPAARKDGLGASVAGRPGGVEVFIAAAAVGLTLVVPFAERIVIWAVGVILALVTPRIMAKRVGGMSGDVLGASIIVVETAVLFLAGLIGA